MYLNYKYRVNGVGLGISKKLEKYFEATCTSLLLIIVAALPQHLLEMAKKFTRIVQFTCSPTKLG